MDFHSTSVKHMHAPWGDASTQLTNRRAGRRIRQRAFLSMDSNGNVTTVTSSNEALRWRFMVLNLSS
jgi:hypothetical protein